MPGEPIEPHVTVLDVDDGPFVLIHPASREAFETVLMNNHSPPVFVRLPNGDLIVGWFPRDDGYFAIEKEAEYPGERPELLWCETCGERPQVVHAKYVGLCVHCAAETIDKLSDEVAARPG